MKKTKAVTIKEQIYDITRSEANAMIAVGSGADVFNTAVACDLRRLQMKIPMIDRFLVFIPGKSRNPQPHFGAKVTEAGLALAKRYSDDTLTSIQGVVLHEQNSRAPKTSR